MDIFSSPDLLVLGIVAASNLILGAVIYFSDTKSVTRKYFFFLTLSVTAFNVITYFSYKFHNLDVVIWLARLVLVSVIPYAVYFYLLVKNFPSDTQLVKPRNLKLIYVWSLFTILVILSPFVFTGAQLVNGIVKTTAGPGILIFTLTVIFFDFGGIWIIAKKAFQSKPENRAQNYLLLFGFLTMKIPNIIFNFIFPAFLGNIKFLPYSIAFSLPFVILTSYAIIKHHLLNVKVITTEILTFLLALATLSQVLFAGNLLTIIFRLSIFALVLGFGVLLIKSVTREVEQRERMEKLSKDLELANVKLKQLDEAKSQFLSVASHQLRTPLTAIKGYVSMLQEGDFGEVNPQQKDVMAILFDSSQRLVELISDLLDLSRIESGTMEFNFEAVDLCKIIDSVIEEVRPKTEAHKLYLFFDNVNRSCPMIRADTEKLRQVVINLIDNAVKYTTHGGVTVRLHQVGDRLRFEVADTGIGIDQADQPKLFQKFFRADAANEITREGTGLGVYVVQKLVVAMKGKIWFESPGINKGTTFFVDFEVPNTPIKPERVKIENLF